MKITKQLLSEMIKEEVEKIVERGDGSNPMGILAKRMRMASSALSQNRNHAAALQALYDAVAAVHPETRF